jgi:hypothetical protein
MLLIDPRHRRLGLVLPLCTSSAMVGVSLLRHPLFLAFLRANETTTKDSKPKTRQDHRPASVPLLERFLRPCKLSHHRHSSHVFKANLIIARWLRSHGTLETTTIGRWHMYGSMLDLGHLAFVSLVAGPIQKITNASKLPCWWMATLKRGTSL